MKLKNNKLTIVIPTIIFSDYTGVELYVYELSRELVQLGHRVIIVAPDPSGDIVKRVQSNGVEVYSFESCPDTITPDILHLNEQLPSMFALSKWPAAPAVASIHSQFPVEAPFISERIQSYICIRSEIIDHVKDNYPQIKDRLKLIHNGFDFQRFRNAAKPVNRKSRKTVLFVGTIDAIRKASIEHLIDQCAKEDVNLKIVGKKYENYLNNPPAHVEVLPPRWEVEELFTEDVIATAGVLLGRSTIEGWIVGRPGWIYDIETNGNVKSFKLHEVPTDIDKFDSRNVTNDIVSLYISAINNKTSSLAESNLKDLNLSTSILTGRSVMSGNTAYLLIKKADYLEEIIANNSLQIEELSKKVDHLEKDLERVHQRVHSVERYSPKNISKKLKNIAANMRKSRDSGSDL